MLHCVVGDEVNEVEVGDELLVVGGVEGVEDDAAASGVALDVEGGLGGGSLLGCAASLADVALLLLGSVALADDLAPDVLVVGVGVRRVGVAGGAGGRDDGVDVNRSLDVGDVRRGAGERGPGRARGVQGGGGGVAIGLPVWSVTAPNNARAMQ